MVKEYLPKVVILAGPGSAFGATSFAIRVASALGGPYLTYAWGLPDVVNFPVLPPGIVTTIVVCDSLIAERLIQRLAIRYPRLIVVYVGDDESLAPSHTSFFVPDNEVRVEGNVLRIVACVDSYLGR